jgi:hypothetical protein
MFKTNRTRTFLEKTNNNSIIFSIVTNDVSEVKNLITNKNYNTILDENTGFTALHYAISSPNISNDIIKYLLLLGANPKDKINNQDIDSFDLALKYNKRYLFEYFNKIKDEEIIVLTDKNKILQNRFDKLKESNNYLLDSIDSYNIKISKLNEEIITLKRKNEETETAFNNLLKRQKK